MGIINNGSSTANPGAAMKQLKLLAESWLLKLFMPVISMLLLALVTVAVYSYQADQAQAKEQRMENKTEISCKADKQDVKDMITLLREDVKEQKNFNEKIYRKFDDMHTKEIFIFNSLNELKGDIRVLRERIK